MYIIINIHASIIIIIIIIIIHNRASSWDTRVLSIPFVLISSMAAKNSNRIIHVRIHRSISPECCRVMWLTNDLKLRNFATHAVTWQVKTYVFTAITKITNYDEFYSTRTTHFTASTEQLNGQKQKERMGAKTHTPDARSKIVRSRMFLVFILVKKSSKINLLLKTNLPRMSM